MNVMAYHFWLYIDRVYFRDAQFSCTCRKVDVSPRQQRVAVHPESIISC